jgi:low affinity Fe/Cu permease
MCIKHPSLIITKCLIVIYKVFLNDLKKIKLAIDVIVTKTTKTDNERIGLSLNSKHKTKEPIKGHKC